MTRLRVQYKGKGKEEVADGVGLLISILLRYPEVSVIRYEPNENVLGFSFISSDTIDDEYLKKIETTLIDGIEAWNLLENRKPKIMEIYTESTDGLSKIEMLRDMDSLSLEEVSLLVSLLDQMGVEIIVEGNESYLEEDLLLQEEVIRHLLDNIKKCDYNKNLFAFREEGRVLVFNQ